ncbi:glycoside hydrolase family 95 protein [Mucilaginibacter ginsenosidivorans]|uniref:Glycoside hydrolase family 95 protein n=1 Tax=Mucilaginibacter ginsenosidivorans TaxID=398053 RepID=A0A5B8USW0_9SPHI|nr:glycoside hydrolase family 95 protein [Mucilaginibacter ginsenosidivorans]QEC62069.1 glycoside hydrolase family 95 protein [Mucilaginibacter ginsenosidivorans]
MNTKTARRFFPLITALLFLNNLCPGQQQPLKLWYDKPAQVWEETLPLGNGRLGMMPDGGVTKENIVLNDITLWSGAPQDANNYEAYKALPQIRKLLLEGRNDEAQALINKDFVCTGKGGASVPFGCYQVLGDLAIQFKYNNTDSEDVKFQNYERELSLNNAIAKCSYQVNGITYTREYFTSFGNDISVVKLTADKPGQLNCTISISRPERGTASVNDNELQLSGQLDNGTDGNGMQYIARVRAKLKGGTINASNQTLVIKDATEAIIYISAGTDFKEKPFKQKTEAILATALKTPYAAEKRHHISNYQKLFNRVSIILGNTNNTTETTDKRLISFHKDPSSDNGLAALFFQFGRYLSICSTRVGLLPPNLQGLWANQIQTPWNGDYHLDINVQMNHWPLEMANLSELNLPLVELVRGMIKHGERTAKAYYNADGWVAHVITNPWHFTEPGEEASWGISKSGSGWLCNNIWEHYTFTNNKKYLQSIYPILKGSAQFYNSILVKDPKTGWLVTSPSSSPENSFYMPNGKTSSICMGATIDNQIIRELFENVITASKVLGIDAAFRKELTLKLKEIPPPGVIAKDGRIQEWLEDYKETEPHHRHIAHLYGLYPAQLITPEKTPALAEAAKKTLNVRGDDGPGWSIAYKILFWARLEDGERAYKLYTELMKPTVRTDINYGSGGGIYPNLLDAGPPFQIDGNFGGTAGIGEMLIQSHAGYIGLIPAIPAAWKSYGKVSGLRARGNFTVDMEWRNGKITSYRITSPSPRKVKVKVNGVMKEVMAEKAS